MAEANVKEEARKIIEKLPDDAPGKTLRIWFGCTSGSPKPAAIGPRAA